MPLKAHTPAMNSRAICALPATLVVCRRYNRLERDMLGMVIAAHGWGRQAGFPAFRQYTCHKATQPGMLAFHTAETAAAIGRYFVANTDERERRERLESIKANKVAMSHKVSATSHAHRRSNQPVLWTATQLTLQFPCMAAYTRIK